MALPVRVARPPAVDCLSAGTYTYRVSAFRGSEADSANWTRSAEVTIP